MPRVARIVVPRMPHHVTQRGNRHDDVFFEPSDYALYKKLLEKYSKKFGLDIYAYCLMTNHIHIVAVPHHENSLGFTLRDTHQTYAIAINRRHRQTGHLWQGRYYSCVLDTSHMWAAIRYVENNPVRAGMAPQAHQYEHSSARAHCGVCADPLLCADFATQDMGSNWYRWLQHDTRTEEQAVRMLTRSGKPCGSDSFIANLEPRLRRPVKKQAPGTKPVINFAPNANDTNTGLID